MIASCLSAANRDQHRKFACFQIKCSNQRAYQCLNVRNDFKLWLFDNDSVLSFWHWFASFKRVYSQCIPWKYKRNFRLSLYFSFYLGMFLIANYNSTCSFDYYLHKDKVCLSYVSYIRIFTNVFSELRTL